MKCHGESVNQGGGGSSPGELLQNAEAKGQRPHSAHSRAGKRKPDRIDPNNPNIELELKIGFRLNFRSKLPPMSLLSTKFSKLKRQKSGNLVKADFKLGKLVAELETDAAPHHRQCCSCFHTYHITSADHPPPFNIGARSQIKSDHSREWVEVQPRTPS